jgi:hypothetical protein
MSTDNAFAMNAVQRIAAIWQVDKARSEWSADGFDWWPGDYRVRVCAQAAADEENAGAWRLLVRTDCLKNVPVHEKRFISLADASSHTSTSTYAWVYPPASAWDEYDDVASNPPPFWFSSTAYLRTDNSGWLPDFLAKCAIMQPINAQIQAQMTAEILGGGVPDVSRPDTLKHAGLDEMLEVAAVVYGPLGEKPSRWAGTDEFETFAERWCQSDNCFGFGDPTGLTIETPFGSDSALIRLRSDQRHPQLGNGLLATLQLPFFNDALSISKESATLNFLEAISWTNFPQLGCWHSHQGRGGARG